MPRGVYERGKSKEMQVEPMSAEELAAMEERTKNVKSPLPEPRAPEGIIDNSGAIPRRVIGHFTKPAQVGDAGTLKAFARIDPMKTHKFKGWIKMTPEDASNYESQRLLVGYDADYGMGKIKED